MTYRDTAFVNDDRILQAAFYQESKGLLIKVANQDAVNDRFSEFKSLVMRKSYTIEQLEDWVYGKFGVPEKRIDGWDSLCDALRVKKENDGDIDEVDEEYYEQEETEDQEE